MFYASICDLAAYVYAEQLRPRRDEIWANLEKRFSNKEARLLDEKKVRQIRSDTEPVLMKEPFQEVPGRTQAEWTHQDPYSPQMNGLAESFIYTLSGAVRVYLSGVGPRLSSYAVKFAAYLQRGPRIRSRHSRSLEESPNEVRSRTRDGSLQTLATVNAVKKSKAISLRVFAKLYSCKRRMDSDRAGCPETVFRDFGSPSAPTVAADYRLRPIGHHSRCAPKPRSPN